MAQITLYLDDSVAEKLADAAKREHVTESAWVGRLIADRLGAKDETESGTIHSLVGKWEDERSTEQIIADVKSYSLQRARPSLD